MPTLAYAGKLHRIFSHFRIQFVLDLGANTGQFHDLLRGQVGFRGEIHSFEPIATLVDDLNPRALSDPLWSIHPLALGSERGEREINVMNSTVLSSFLEPVYDAVPEFTSLNTVTRKELVKVETLDALLGAALRGVDLKSTFLKLDAQGFDLEGS